MSARRGRPTAGVAGWLTVAAALALGIPLWLGYSAYRERQRSEELLADRRARETVDLLVTALTRDMRGAQHSVLSEWWGELTVEPPHEMRNVVAAAFARYPYPESFFTWRTTDRTTTFFNRSERRPAWSASDPPPNPFPVVLTEHDGTAEAILGRLRDEAKRGRRFAAFDVALGAEPYQVIARLFYRDAYRHELAGVAGFTVNMRWVRAHYFPAMARQTVDMGAGLPFAIIDSAGETVAGTTRRGPGGSNVKRWFPLLFIDPTLVGIDSPADLSQEFWAAQVAVDYEAASGAAAGGRLLWLATLAATTLVVGVFLTARATRASARAAAMRSEFVATVTHELKTPIATIRAAGDTLARVGVLDADAQRDYARMVVDEAKRLGRLVENLLAYARVTDVTEVYAFGPVDLSVLVDDVVHGARVQLAAGGFDVAVDHGADVPPVRGDEVALRLMIDNLVDNAIRYSDAERVLRIDLVVRGREVVLDVRDRGVGISEEDLERVTQKFVRGKGARPGGSGLGLAIVRRIVDDHDGTLTITSTRGAGTTVSVRLPVA